MCTTSRKGIKLLSAFLAMALLTSSLLTAQAKTRPMAPTIDTPSPISPADGEETTGNPADPDTSRVLYEPMGIPTFKWQDVGATKYHLEVATTGAFGDSIIFDDDDIEYPTYTPTGFEGLSKLPEPGFGLTDDGQGNFIDQADFYWHVRAWDKDLAQWSDWSNTWQFTRHWGFKPNLTSPADKSIQKVIPHFKWEPVPGAAFYEIQIDTDDGFGTVIVEDTTDVPAFVPTGLFYGEKLENDDDLFWRVRAVHRKGTSYTYGRAGEWSDVYEFKLAWSTNAGGNDTRPTLLIPPNNATLVNRPLFCWQPVAGAKQYIIDASTSPAFTGGEELIKSETTESTCYVSEGDKNDDLDVDMPAVYWRVSAVDGQGFEGQTTDIDVGAFQFSTTPSETVQVPSLFYPPYYYPPIMDETFEDRTVAVPTFVWDHVEGATSYTLRIDDDQPMWDPPTFIVTTTNASFTFTDTATYPLTDGQIYYWKVKANAPQSASIEWNDIQNKWKVRVDRGQLPVDDTVKLIKPTYQTRPWTNGHKYGQESVTYYPVFGWTAVAATGSATYGIEIAHDDGFANRVHTAQTEFTEYTPLERADPGTYFWRVRQVAPSTGDWSETGRFIVSRDFAAILWDDSETPAYDGDIAVDGDPNDWPLAGVPAYSDEAGDVSGIYDLAEFHVANDGEFWYLGVPLSPTVKLGLYFDRNHLDGSGGSAAPSGQADPGAPPAHQPEYAVYWWDDSSMGSAVYQWIESSSSWSWLGSLANISADSAYSTTTRFLEIQIPVAQLGSPGSLSLMMFSIDGSEVVQDRLPNQPGQPTTSAFLTEGTTPTQLFPADAPNDASIATIEHNTPVLTWRRSHIPYDKIESTYSFVTYEDDTLTNPYEGDNVLKLGAGFNHSTAYWAPLLHYSDNNSYNWLVFRGGYFNIPPNHFRKQGYLATDLQFSPLVVSGTITYTNRTPSFAWQAVQSAPSYRWELLKGGDSSDKKMITPYYTPREAIEDGTYTWKVWTIDARNREGTEAAQGVFSKVSDLVPVQSAEFTSSTLVLRWDPVDHAAYYFVDIASDPNFSDVKTYKTYNATFTPEKIPSQTIGGAFYWRVYSGDNRNNTGPYIDLYIDIYPEKLYLPLVLK